MGSIDLLDNGTADPRTTQKRLAATPSGRQVWVDISGDDRLRIIKALPSRWPEVLMARERGESLDSIARWVKVPPPCKPRCQLFTPRKSELDVLEPEEGHVGEPCLAWHVADAYRWVETEIQALASKRARLLP